MQLGPHSLVKNGRIVDYHPQFKTFDQFLTKLAKKYGQKSCIIFDDFVNQTLIKISYSELDKFTHSVALSLLNDSGLKPGDHLSFTFENTPEIVLINYAAWRVGLITVPLDITRDTLERKIYKLKFTDTKLLITRSNPKTVKQNSLIKKSIPRLKIIEIEDFSDFKQKLLRSKSATYDLRPTISELNNDCLILFTSGTTALPKGVRLSLTSLFANAESIADWMQFDDQDRFHILIPLHHINSVTFTNTTLLSGGTIILSPRYSKSNFWPTMAKHKSTGASIVPTIAYDLLSEKSSFKSHQKNLSQIRRIQIGSAPVQPQVVEKFMDQFNIPLIQGYGQTETSLRSAGVPMDLSKKQSAHIRKINSLGTELKFTNVTILDKHGQEVKQGKLGEICIRGPIIMTQYLKNPTANQEAFAFNWFHSGDTGYYKNIYGHKFFFLKGRTKEIIKKGGVLISPLAIENTLLENYPDLDKVYVVGFPDQRMGQEIGFVAITKKPEVVNIILSDLHHKKVNSLASYEYPQAAFVIKDSDLPKTSTGKIQRIKISETFGPKLLKQSRTIYPSKLSERSGAASPKLTFRLIGPEEKSVLKSALKINNLRWGKHLQSNLSEFTARAQNGLLIGAFDSKEKLAGTVSAIHLNQGDLEEKWAQTWDGVTGKGTLSTHNHKGDSLLCVAISTKITNAPQKGRSLKGPSLEDLKGLTPKTLKEYLSSNLDLVIAFHRRPKAGLKSGAKIVKIIKNGRPADQDSLGYNILMQYPTPTKTPTINSQATIGTQLIEAALLYVYYRNLKNVFVYTRPAHLSKYFKK